MIRFHRWVDRNPWLPWLHGSDGLTGKRRLALSAEYVATLQRCTERRQRGQQ